MLIVGSVRCHEVRYTSRVCAWLRSPQVSPPSCSPGSATAAACQVYSQQPCPSPTVGPTNSKERRVSTGEMASKRLTNSRVSENSLHVRKQYSIGAVRALVSSPERAPEGLGESVNTRVPPPLFCCCRFIACCCCRCFAFCSSLCFSCSLVRTSFRAPCHPCVLLTCTSHEQDDNTTKASPSKHG